MRDGKELSIAKFPRRDDDWPVIVWEAVCLALAQAAGVEVPRSQLRRVLRKPVLILRRFDRDGRSRIPFMSGLAALAARDGEMRSYLELVEVLRREGSEVNRDLRQLWRRVVFNILVSNTDDHLRNHGFLRDPRGWRLAPASDLNPMPVDVRPRVHALAIDEVDATGSLDLALSVARQFGLVKRAVVRSIVGEVAAVVSRWRGFAKKAGLTKAQIERMTSAFDHDDLRAATAMT